MSLRTPWGIGILGLGTALGSRRLLNTDWPAEYVEQFHALAQSPSAVTTLVRQEGGLPANIPPELAALIEHHHRDPFKGCHTRYHASPEEHASDLEIRAARAALADAGWNPEDVDCLLVSSFIPDRIQPRNGGTLHHALGLGDAPFMELDMACASSLAHLVVGCSLVRSGLYRRVLAVTSTLPSRVHDMSRPVATGLSDGAAAVAIGEVGEGRGLIDHLFVGMSDFRDALAFRHREPEEGDGRRWYDPHEHGLHATALDREKAQEMLVGAFDFFTDITGALLDRAGYASQDLDFLAPTGSFAWSVPGYRQLLGLGEEQSYDSFPEAGSMNTVSALYNLDRGRAVGHLSAGDLVLIFAPGAGMNNCAALLRW